MARARIVRFSAHLVLGFAVVSFVGGCAHVKVRDEFQAARPGQPAKNLNSGLKVYPPKPYIVVEAGEKGDLVKLVSVPDLANPQRVEQIPGWGTAEMNVTIENGMITTFGQKGDSKGPETITALAGGFASVATGLGTLATAGGAGGGLSDEIKGKIIDAIIGQLTGPGTEDVQKAFAQSATAQTQAAQENLKETIRDEVTAALQTIPIKITYEVEAINKALAEVGKADRALSTAKYRQVPQILADANAALTPLAQLTVTSSEHVFKTLEEYGKKVKAANGVLTRAKKQLAANNESKKLPAPKREALIAAEDHVDAAIQALKPILPLSATRPAIYEVIVQQDGSTDFVKVELP